MPVTYLSLPRQAQKLLEFAYSRGQHIYFILSEQHKLVKIGIARHPIKRLRQMQTGSPTDLELIYVIPYGGYLIETQLHAFFKSLHHRGEWYDYKEPIKEYIRDCESASKETGLRWDLTTGKIVV